MKLFNPDDTPEYVMYDSKTYRIDPGWNELPSHVARHAELTLGKWGIRCLLPEGESETEAKAKEAWRTGTKEWAEQILIDFHKVNKDRLDAGLKVDEPDVVKEAKKFLGR